VVSLTGHGTALIPVWNGVPVSSVGVPSNADILKRASFRNSPAWFQQHGQWQDGSYTPKAGDIIFFDWEGDGTTDHVGIVEKVENDTVYTIEGNSGDACKQRNYPDGSSVIIGYAIPMY